MFATLSLAIVLFASSNIDDLFVLLSFFADSRFRVRSIVIGQYLGIGALVLASLIVAWVALAVPAKYVGLLGLLPVFIGVKKLLDLRKPAESSDATTSPGAGLGNILAVAAVTMANGWDNIGIYTPVFATSSARDLAIMAVTFVVMVAIWLAAAKWLVHHPTLGAPIRRYGHILTPLVLIGIGIYVLVESDVWSSA